MTLKPHIKMQSKRKQWWKNKLFNLKNKFSIKLHKLTIFKIIFRKCKKKCLLSQLSYKPKKIISTRETLKLMSFFKPEKSYKMKLMILSEIKKFLLRKSHNFNLCSILKENWNKNICHFSNKRKQKTNNLKHSLIILWNKNKEQLNPN